MSEFRPVSCEDGYLPIEDHGLIGDGATAALVGRDGAISWMCAPRFDSPPLFCRLLDAQRGGAFTVTPEGLIESRQYYEPGAAVLVTEMLGPTGLARVTDALTLRQGANLTEDTAHGHCELAPVVEALRGNARLRIEVEPQGGGAGRTARRRSVRTRPRPSSSRFPVFIISPAAGATQSDRTPGGRGYAFDAALGRRRQQT